MPIPVPSVGVGVGAPVVSADGGVLTATSGPFGVVLQTDFSRHASDASSALWVSVTRSFAGVAGGFVRGLHDYPSIGAMTVGIDAEARFGVAITYVATARAADGTTWSSTGVTLTQTAHRNRAWLKCLSTPSLSVQVTGDAYPDWSRETPTGVFRPPLRRDPIVRQGLRQMGTGTLTLHSLVAAEIAAMDVLMQAGGPYLLQADALNGMTRPDVYLAVQSDTGAQPYGDPEYRSWTLPVIELPRPTTRDSRVSLPGHTIDDAAIRYGALDNYPRPAIRLLTD